MPAMIPFRRLLAALPLFLVLGGCGAAAPGTRDPAVITVMTGGGESYQIRRGADVRVAPTVAATPAATWSVLGDVYRGLGLEPDVVDVSSRTLGVSAQRLSRRFLDRSLSDFFDCGLDPGLNRPLADQVPLTVRIVTEVVASGAGSALGTVAEGTARQSGGNAGMARCRSTGLLEALIGQMAERAVATGG